MAFLSFLMMAVVALKGSYPPRAPEVPPRAVVASVVGFRVDDSIDVFDSVDESALPVGVQRRAEAVGPSWNRISHYIQLVPQGQESLATGLARIEPWLKTVRLPADTRLAWEPIESVDEKTGSVALEGWRSYLVKGEACLSSRDIESAAVVESEDVRWSVRIRLRPEATEPLQRITHQMRKQRIALMIDGLIATAPRVNWEMSDRDIEINMGMGSDREASRVEAVRLLQRLTGHR